MNLVNTTERANDLASQFDDLKNAMEQSYKYETELNEALQEQKLDALKEYLTAAKQAAAEEAAVKAKQDAAAATIHLKRIQDEQKIKYKLEHQNEKKLSKLQEQYYKKELDRIKKTEKKRIEYVQKSIEKEAKLKEKQRSIEERKQLAASLTNAMTGSGVSLAERGQAFKNAFRDEDGSINLSKGFSALTESLSDLTSQLKDQIESIASSKSAIDTRLQGSKNATSSGSYWEQISKDITSIAGSSPYIKQESVVTNLKSMVSSGISYNVEQRAFLETLKTTIADTFSATNTTLTRLVRIQQQDSTAARLGMESALTAFLNNMYETTEYMGSIMDGIKGSLEEAMALMSATEATEFEYQVQKWMGSMYSVGMSQNGVNSIASALGQLAAGDISSISSGGTGNLLVMAANNAGISIADALADGLDDSSTNKLMNAMVEYLSQIYEETKESKVVQQQYASVFGLTAADLKAISNLSTSDLANISGTNLSYSGMLTQLANMTNSMGSRISQGEMLTNLTSNWKYTLSSSIASNPALYSMFTLANTLDSLVGGIDFSTPLVAGTGTAQTFNVADLMKTATLSGGIISGLSSIIGGLSGNSGGLLNRILGTGSTNVSRGNATGLITTSGSTTSSSGYIGNSESSDVLSKTMTDQTDSSNSQTISAVEESNETTLSEVDASITKIYDLLLEVTNGISTFKVDMGDSSAWTMAMKGL